MLRAFGRVNVLVNVSLWTDYPSLHTFSYHGLHGRYLTDHARWFDPLPGPTTALWWVAASQRPSVDSARNRLLLLRRIGPSPVAFTVLQRWNPDGERERRRQRSGFGAP